MTDSIEHHLKDPKSHAYGSIRTNPLRLRKLYHSTSARAGLAILDHGFKTMHQIHPADAKDIYGDSGAQHYVHTSRTKQGSMDSAISSDVTFHINASAHHKKALEQPDTEGGLVLHHGGLPSNVISGITVNRRTAETDQLMKKWAAKKAKMNEMLHFSEYRRGLLEANSVIPSYDAWGIYDENGQYHSGNKHATARSHGELLPGNKKWRDHVEVSRIIDPKGNHRHLMIRTYSYKGLATAIRRYQEMPHAENNVVMWEHTPGETLSGSSSYIGPRTSILLKMKMRYAAGPDKLSEAVSVHPTYMKWGMITPDGRIVSGSKAPEGVHTHPDLAAHLDVSMFDDDIVNWAQEYVPRGEVSEWFYKSPVSRYDQKHLIVRTHSIKSLQLAIDNIDKLPLFDTNIVWHEHFIGQHPVFEKRAHKSVVVYNMKQLIKRYTK